MKHIVKFSGGAASSYLAWLVAEEHGRDNTVLLHTPTYSEHPDADRFRSEVADYIGLPITVAEDGRDLWQLIDDNHCVPLYFRPFCTRILKIEPSEKWLESAGERALYLGFGPDEWRRVQRSSGRDQTARFPLFDRKITSDECKRIIRDDWKIKLPTTYETLKHNNCLPCFKAGRHHFKAIWVSYREYFDKAVAAEKKWGHFVFDISLPELAERWKDEPTQATLCDSAVPCECWA